MFCPECGEKNEKEATFCANCGTKLKKETAKKQGTSVKEKWIGLSKQKKIGFVSILCIVLFCGIFYTIGKNLTSPEKVAEKYFLACTSYDASKIYDFLPIESNEFTSREMFKKVMNEDIEEEKVKIVNYKVGNATINEDGLTANVKIRYTLKDSEKTYEETITLKKGKNKKWFLFDRWTISTSDDFTTTNVKIQVMKGAKLYLNEIEVNQKYLSSDITDRNIDTYELPELFQTTYTAKVVYPFGEIEEEISISSYSTLKTITKLNVNKENEDKLKSLVSSNLNILYENALKKTPFESMKDSLSYHHSDENTTNTIKKVYEKLLDALSKYTEISDLKFSEMSTFKTKLTTSGEVYVTANVIYKYKVLVNEEEKEYNDSDTVYMTYIYKDGSFKLTNAESLNTYFRRF